MTINKIEGQTFDKICLYFPNPVFGHRQVFLSEELDHWTH